MNISSAQTNCSITSSDTFTIDLSPITISTTDTIDIGTITLNNTGASGTYTIGSGVSQDYVSIWTASEEWGDSFPDWDRIQKMCKEYPGLKIAFEKFKTTYMLVKDDYDAPPNKKIRP